MVEIDARNLSIRELNNRIRDAAGADDDLAVIHPEARHNIAVGLTRPVRLAIRGSAGYFCAGLVDGPTVDVAGNVGWGFGDNLVNGVLRVDGSAGAVCGVAMRSGHILVRGNVGSRAGQVMKGGTLVCMGNAGFRAGSMMMGGALIVLGDARADLGEFIMDGQIFVAGTIDSLGEDAVEVPFEATQREQVDAALARHGLSHPGVFRRIISDQRALRYAEYEKGELLFNEAQTQKAKTVAADGNRDVMPFDAD